VAKLVNNMIGLACNSICAEGLVLGVKAGIDPQALYDLLTISTANNWSLQQYPNTVFTGNFAPGFKISPSPTRTSTWRSLSVTNMECRCPWLRR
jgi:3-hydroxyisobutyrate dehydrogenase